MKEIKEILEVFFPVLMLVIAGITAVYWVTRILLALILPSGLP